MIQTIVDAIVEQLSDTPGLAGDVGPFSGDADELLSRSKRLPAMWVVYDGAKFDPRQLVGAIRADHEMRFTVVLLAKNYRSRADGAEACHTIIEAVRSRLIGHTVSTYGELWPVEEALIDASGPLMIYGLTYRLQTEYSPS